nr:hypothetical protein [Nitrosomonas nitrosa]
MAAFKHGGCVVHQQPSEQHTRQQDGEEIHQADEEFLGVEIHLSPSLFSPIESCCLAVLIIVV